METLRSPRFWFGILISAVTLWLAFRTVPFATLGETLARANFLWILPAIVIQFLAVWSRAQRWNLLLGKKAGVATTYWGHSIGFLFTNVLPFRMGEPARIVVVSGKTGIPVIEVTASVLVERVLDVATVVLGLVLVLPFMQVPELVSKAGLTLGVIVVVALVCLWLVVRFREQSDRLVAWILSRLKFLPAAALQARWSELVQGLAPITRPALAAQALFWSIVSWIFSTAIYYCVMQAYQPLATPMEALFMVVTLAFAVTVPSSPGFIGVFQYVGQQALVLPFGAKYSDSTALAITMVSYIIYYFFTTGLGLAGLWRMGESFSNLGKLISSKRKTVEGD